jgi:hypothetical protein
MVMCRAYSTSSLPTSSLSPTAVGSSLRPRQPVEGAERVANLMIRAMSSQNLDATPIWLNGSPGIWIDAGPGRSAAVSVAIHDSRITHVYFNANPHKLVGLATTASLTRT